MAARIRRIRVLLVEDDPRVRSFITDVLSTDAEVVEAEDIGQALAALTQKEGKRFDLAVIDCLLGGGAGPAGGIELVEQLRTERPWLPVIAITGASGSEPLVIEAFRRGARDFLKKPFGIEELTTAIARVAPRWRPRPRREPGSKVAINRAIAFVGEHYTEPLSLSHLATMTQMSRSHFCRVFRGVVGTSLRDYVRELRLARAQHLLSTSTRSLTDIALEVGFYDLPHFDKAFRRRFGISPTEFQRRKGLARVGGSAVPGVERRDVHLR
jgi:AraC-like DNA-binding protein